MRHLKEVESGDIGQRVLVVLQVLHDDLQRLFVVIVALGVDSISALCLSMRACVCYLGKIERMFEVAGLSAHLDGGLHLELQVRSRLQQ
jgi:hypothetical protein